MSTTFPRSHRQNQLWQVTEFFITSGFASHVHDLNRKNALYTPVCSKAKPFFWNGHLRIAQLWDVMPLGKIFNCTDDWSMRYYLILKFSFIFFWVPVPGPSSKALTTVLQTNIPSSHHWHTLSHPRKQVFMRKKCKHSDLWEHCEAFLACIFGH